MPLPASQVARTPLHTRSVRIEAFWREDGCLDLEAALTDVKPHDLHLQSGVRPAGEPVHQMWLRVTVGQDFCVVDAQAISERVPYPGHCEPVSDDYRALVGLHLMKGFGRALRERLAGVAGCTHLSELAQLLPTAAVQAMAGTEPARRVQEAAERAGRQPFQLDKCHAMRTDGEAVRRYYPKWYASTETKTAQPATQVE